MKSPRALASLAILACSIMLAGSTASADKINCPNAPPAPAGSYCQSPGIPIDPASPVVDTMVITETGTIADLDVYLDIPHTFVGDLAVTLDHVGGCSVLLMDRPGVPATFFGCSSDDIDATLDDEAALAIETECSATPPAIGGTLIPEAALSACDGEDISGTWTLTVTDGFLGLDSGTLSEWCLIPDAGPKCLGLAVTCIGTPGDDIILGTTGADVISALGGDDTVKAKGGDDTICGGPGDDSIVAGAGDDDVSAGDGEDDVNGGNGNDTITGNAGGDTIKGGGGEDTLLGGTGDDVVEGGASEDTLFGQGGNDILKGGAGDDGISGGGGDDTLTGNAGDDTFDGGPGADTCTDPKSGDTVIDCG